MLVLSRKPGEAIQIGDAITVTVVEIRDGRVRLGVDAPLTTKILRTELQELPPGRFVERDESGTEVP